MRGSVLIPVAMIAFATVSSVALLRDEIIGYVHRTPNVIGIPDSAVMSLRSIVPKGETFGFLSDRNNPEVVDKRLYSATYSLAPSIVERTANRRFIIGDFRSKSNIPMVLERHQLHIVEDLGNGFLLLSAQ
jgi:hypothetical protein